MTKNVLFCITGSIAAIKAPFIIRALKDQGFLVTCIVTEAAKKFITPFSLTLLSDNTCYEDLDFWSENNLHINLARTHDILLIAPATANTIAKCATGIANNLMLNCFVAFEGKKVIVPAMHTEMINNKIVQNNIEKCKNMGCLILGPTYGNLLSEDKGEGRMIEPEEIAQCITSLQFNKLNLRDKPILITAGGTTEDIDPVRTLSNRSSGKLGESLARLAYINDAKVIVISSHLIENIGYQKVVKISNSNELKQSMDNSMGSIETLIMAAAVSDYLPIYQNQKIRREKQTEILVEKNEDVLSYITKTYEPKITVGFCLQDDINDSKTPFDKLYQKKCNYIIANDSSNIANDKRSYKIYNANSCIDSFKDVSVHEAAYNILKNIS